MKKVREQKFKATVSVALSDCVTFEAHDGEDYFRHRLINTETGKKGEWVTHDQPAMLANKVTMYPSGFYIYWMPGQEIIGLSSEHLHYIYEVNP